MAGARGVVGWATARAVTGCGEEEAVTAAHQSVALALPTIGRAPGAPAAYGQHVSPQQPPTLIVPSAGWALAPVAWLPRG